MMFHSVLLGVQIRGGESKSASGFGPGGSISASGFGPGGSISASGFGPGVQIREGPKSAVTPGQPQPRYRVCAVTNPIWRREL